MCQARSFLRRKKEFKNRRRKCNIPSTHVIINERDKKYKICNKCWRKICRAGVEW